MPIQMPDELQAVTVPSFVKPPSQTNTMERNSYINRNNEAVRMNRAYIPETRFERIPAPNVQSNTPKKPTETPKQQSPQKNFSLFNGGSATDSRINLDKDTLLVIALVVLLGKEKVDIKLLMALVSILF